MVDMSTKEKIVDIISGLMEDETVKERLAQSDDLTQIGINSISFIKLVVELENTFDIEFEDDALDYFKFESLETLCAYVEQLKEKTGQ